MNTPFGNSITTAEHAISLMMAVARQIPSADASTRQGKWEKSKFMGVELTGKTLGLIGAGNIGGIGAWVVGLVERRRGGAVKLASREGGVESVERGHRAHGDGGGGPSPGPGPGGPLHPDLPGPGLRLRRHRLHQRSAEADPSQSTDKVSFPDCINDGGNFECAGEMHFYNSGRK